MISDTTVDAGYQPIASRGGGAIVEGRLSECIAHECAYIVIAGHAVNRQLQGGEQLAKMFVGADAIVLNQVARNDNKVGAPVIIAIVIEHGTQRRIGHGAAQISRDIGEQVRVRKVQNPQRMSSAVDRPRPRA